MGPTLYFTHVLIQSLVYITCLFVQMKKTYGSLCRVDGTTEIMNTGIY